MIDHDEVLEVGEAMRTYGGGFVKELGSLLMRADHKNQQKIKDAWPEYWEQYKNIDKKLKGEQDG